jgi:hypothetical protein
LDAESRSAIKVYVDYVRDVKFKTGGELNIEYRLKNRSIRSGRYQKPGSAPIFGTADAVIYDAGVETIWIIDYKHGSGVAVDVVDNYQLALYAHMALDEWQNVENVHMVIVQPRANHPDGPIREWACFASDFNEWFKIFQGAIRDYQQAKKNPEEHLEAGDHCRWCPAASICWQIRKQALVQAQVDFAKPAIPDPATLELDQLTRVLDAEPMVLGYIRACKARAAQLLAQGTKVPGRKLVKAYGNRKWKDPEHVENFLGAKLGLLSFEYFDRRLKSPAQVKKLLDKEQWTALEAHIERPEKEPQLVLESDRREAVEPKAAVIAAFEKE